MMDMTENIDEKESILTSFTTNKNLSGLRTSLKLVRTIFGDVREKRVTFCFDISGSMYRAFHHFREHLLEALLKMLLTNADQNFNIVLFNSNVYSFSNKHQKCVQENILNVIKWMNRPYYESKSNILGGLIKSFEDYPDAVYLVTDGFVNKNRNELIKNLPHISKGKPINCIMITHKIPPDNTALDFLEDVVSITNGRLTIISIRNFGSVEVLMPIFYEIRPPGFRRAEFDPFAKEAIDFNEMRNYFSSCKACFTKKSLPQTLLGDPMKELPVIAPFLGKDPVSGRCCPFYHPFYHWYWPQYWEGNGPSSTMMWTKNDPQYHSMWKDFRDSRAFICGKKYLDAYNDVCNSVSAGIVLINRKILCLNYTDNNKIYLGKVISQINPMEFVVQFEIYKEYNEIQNSHIYDIVDLEEQKRHSIKKNDYVIAPLDSINGPYEIAMVLEGVETRSGNDRLLPLQNSELKVKFLESNFEKTLELNQAVYISPTLKDNIENRQIFLQSSTSSSSLEDNKKEKYNNEKVVNEICTNENNNNNNNILKCTNDENSKVHFYCNLCQSLCDVCHGCNHRNCKPFGRVSSPVDNGTAKTLEEIDKEILINKTKFHEVNETIADNLENISIDEKDFSEDENNKNIEENEYTNEYVKDVSRYDYDSNYNIAHEIQKSDNFTETDLNWCILRILNRKQKNVLKINDKKYWRYWGRKSIPDIIDPPTTEPYNDPPNWGGCPMPKTIINPVEWPVTAFQTINPHLVADYSPKKMFEVFHEQYHKPSQKPKRDVSCGRNGLSSEEYVQNYQNKHLKYLQGGYPKLEIKYPYVDSVKPLLSSWSTVNVKGNKFDPEKCLRSIDKSRINAQIQRDEANSLNFLHHQTHNPKKVGPTK